GTLASKRMWTSRTPSSRESASRMSFSMASRNGQAGVVSVTVSEMTPSRTVGFFTIPSVTRSLCSSGSITLRRASSTPSSVGEWAPIFASLTLSCPTLAGRAFFDWDHLDDCVVVWHAARIEAARPNEHIHFGPVALETSRLDAVQLYAATELAAVIAQQNWIAVPEA